MEANKTVDLKRVLALSNAVSRGVDIKAPLLCKDLFSRESFTLNSNNMTKNSLQC